MTRDEVIEKIKKLLRMKRGGTPDEIATALALAAELARKHGIDLAAVNPDEATQQIRHESDALKSRLPLEAQLAMAVLVNFFEVHIVLSNRANPVRPWENQYLVNYVGDDHAIRIARMVFVFLQRHFRYTWSHRRNRRLKNRKAFLNGMFLGLCEKLRTRAQMAVTNEAGLVLVGKSLEARTAYVQRHWPNSKDKPLDDEDSQAKAALHAGWIEGRKTEIRSGLNRPEQTARPCLPPAAGQLALF